jgi:hypothetical protein
VLVDVIDIFKFKTHLLRALSDLYSLFDVAIHEIKKGNGYSKERAQNCFQCKVTAFSLQTTSI